MKHILLLSSMFLVSHLTFAQFQKGDKFIGGSFHTEASRSQQKNDLHSRYMALNLNPTIGYFLSSSAAIGLYSALTALRRWTLKAIKAIQPGLREGWAFFTGSISI